MIRMNHLVGLQVPIAWEEVGMPAVPDFGGVVVTRGGPAWAWFGDTPDLPIATFPVVEGQVVPNWSVDHIVVTTPSLDHTVARLAEAGADLRRQTEVKCRPTAFLMAGILVEVIETSPVDVHFYGMALETSEPLEEVAAEWRAAGWDVGEPHDAVQPGRRIFSVGSKHLAVMSPR